MSSSNYFQTIIPFQPLSTNNSDNESHSSSSNMLSPHSSNLTQDTNSSIVRASNNGRKRSLVWSHYEDLSNGKCCCNYCKKIVRARANESMKSHLISCLHAKAAKIDFSDIFPGLKSKALLQLQEEQKLMTFSCTKADDLLARFIFASGVPFSSLDCPEFQDLLKYLNGRYCPFSRRKFVDTIMYDYLAIAEADLRDILDNATSLSLSIDGWTTHTSESIYGVMGILPDGREVFLEAIQMGSTSATAENLFQHLKPIIELVGSSKISSLITDGAANMTALKRTVQFNYPHIKGIKCLVHSLNILCTSYFKIEPLKKLFNECSEIISAFKKSNKLMGYLKDIKTDLGEPSQSFVDLSSTRFATCYLCMAGLIANKNALISLCRTFPLKEHLQDLILDELFWKSVTDVATTIAPLYDTIKMCESPIFRPSDAFFSVLKLVFSQILSLQDKTFLLANDIQSHISVCLTKIVSSYLEDPLIILAVLLDNRYKPKLSDDLVQQSKETLIAYTRSFGASEGLVERIMIDYSKYLSLETDASLEPTIFWSSKEYKSLGPLAKRLMGMVMNSMSCERLFSLMGWISSLRRSRITAQNITAFTKVRMHLKAYQPRKASNIKNALDNIGVCAADNLRRQDLEGIEMSITDETVSLLQRISTKFKSHKSLNDFLKLEHSVEPSTSEDDTEDQEANAIF